MTQEILKNPCGSFLWWIKCNSMLGHNCIFITFNKAKLKIQVETLKQKLKFCKVIYYIYKINIFSLVIKPHDGIQQALVHLTAKVQ